MSCDLICDISSSTMIDCYRTLHSAATVLFYEHDSASDLRGNRDDTSDFVGIDTKRSRLLMIMAKEDVDQRISFSKSLITKFPAINLHSKLRDAHLYIFKHWVLFSSGHLF
jgi:translation initiation factor eIF-2B subunit gamma